MEKQELSYSECRQFIKYILKAMDSLFKNDFKAVRDNIDSAKDMVVDWLGDGEISVVRAEWLMHLLREAIEDYEADDSDTLFETLRFIRFEFIKMMNQLGIKQDSNGC